MQWKDNTFTYKLKALYSEIVYVATKVIVYYRGKWQFREWKGPMLPAMDSERPGECKMYEEFHRQERKESEDTHSWT